MLLVAVLLAALGCWPGPATAQGDKPMGPAAPSAPKDTPDVAAEEIQTPPALSLIQSAASPLETVSCSAPLQNQTTITGAEFAPLGACTLTLPVTATVYLNGNASVTLGGATAFEALFTFTIDGGTLFSARRWVNVYPDGGDGTDETVALSRMVVVGPGTHTFGLQARKINAGDGNIKVYSPILTAIAIPPTSDLIACGAPGGDWSNATSNNTEVAACTITTSVTGTVYLEASGSVTLPPGGSDYEAQFRFGLNDTDLAVPSRWVNISTDSGDGTDRSVSLSRMLVVGPGTHTFQLLGRRATAADVTARVLEPQLSAIFIPSGSPTAHMCASPIQDFSNTSNTFQTATSCQLTVAVTSTVFLHASASVALPTGGSNYEGMFRLGFNSGELIPPTRYINIYTNGDDGTDKTVALSRLITVGPGTHTLRLLGRILTQGGPLQLYHASLGAVVLNNLPDPVYVPVVVRGGA